MPAGPEQVPASVARRLLMHAQGLLDDPARPATAASVFRTIERMGFVQLDTISILERAHHHILSTRFDNYRHSLLDGLHRSGRLFEHMTHDASLIPAGWFPQWRPRFARPKLKQWAARHLGTDSDCLIAETLSRIRREGPLQSRDFESAGDAPRSGAWWDWRPQKIALEYLWRTGALAVTHRRNFNKVYDLTERTLPAEASLPAPDPAAHIEWACSTAIERIGIATPGEIAAFWKSIPPPTAAAWCRAAIADGRLVPVLAGADDGSPPRRALAHPDWRRRASRLPEPPERTRLLNPFDPVIRDRARCLRLFNFDYRFEAFVPRPKRRYGYYVLPILERESLTGRLDARMDRAAGTLHILGLWWEPGICASPDRRKSLGDALDRFGRMLGADRWMLPHRSVNPAILERS